jgi:glucose/arabinose dehydrogenase
MSAIGAERPAPLVRGLDRPTALALGPDGRVYLSLAGKEGKEEDGKILVLKGNQTVPFASGLRDPRALAPFQKWRYVVDQDRIWRIDQAGKATVFTPPEAFSEKHRALQGIAVNELGVIHVSTVGQEKEGALYRIDARGKATLVTDSSKTPALGIPAGLVADGTSHLLALSSTQSGLFRVAVAGGKVEKVADCPGTGGSLCWDWFGRLYITRPERGEVYVVPRPGEKAVLLARGFKEPVGICYNPAGRNILVADRVEGTLTALPAQVPGAEVDETPLPIATAVAFPDLKWTGWDPEKGGKLTALRPLVLTHAGDGSNRVFVATQRGVIHVFPNDQKATKTRVFLDIQSRVRYSDQTNEEGFLGLTFHPRFKENRQFFVFYSPRNEKMTNVVARYRVSKDDPDRADPSSEEVLLRFRKPFWNHDGGTILFGPDGYLYVTHGDGGSANDPFGNGQNLKSLLGKILRIDIDRKEDGKPYAIPKDNPFVGRNDAAPEIWAYGLRNVWRMAFDPRTGALWAGDVGQNLWEEIDLIRKGGNYGWNRREGLHAFGPKGSGPSKEFIEPIWEYHHDLGRSITGGLVYRGKRLKALDGAYLYADYVSAKIWALRYDPEKGRVVANQPIQDRRLPIFSFGEDEKGDAYLLTTTLSGQGIYRLVGRLPPPK